MSSLDCAGKVFALFVLSVLAVSARPNGAPSSACRDMEPGHSDEQKSSSPYVAKPEKLEIFDIESLEVTLQPSYSSYGGFKGFMIMAVDASDVDGFKPIGSFQDINGVAKTMDCAGSPKGALTHTSRDEKTSIIAVWNPPVGFEGFVVFKTAFVKNFNTYWIAVKSTPVKVQLMTKEQSQELKCLTKFEELTRDSGFSPEKTIIYGGNIDDFCKLKQKSAEELSSFSRSFCDNPGLSNNWKEASSTAIGISSMINGLCKNFPSPKAVEIWDQMCESSVKVATTTCLRQSGVSSIEVGTVVYPTDLIIRMMLHHRPPIVCGAINCIISEMQISREACSSDTQKAILDALNLLTGNTCYLRIVDTTTTTIQLTSTTTHSPNLLFFWNDSNSPKYTGCLAITQGPFNRPYQNINSDARSNCNSHFTCRERHPGSSAAFCLRTDANRFCCKSIEFRAGKHFESGCLGECSDGDHAYCGHLSPGQKPAECYQGDHPFHRAFGSVGCCRAEYERVGMV